MMQIIGKMRDRQVKVANEIETFKAIGGQIKQIGEFSKWKEIETGRIQMSVTVYELKLDQRPFGGDEIVTCYLMKDSLGMEMQKTLNRDKKEIMQWIKEHGYKTIKKFYLEDYGMSEETWNEWNGVGTEEE